MSENGSVNLPYVHLLQGQDPLEVMRKTPRRVSDLLKGMAPEEIDHKAGPGRWSVREIVCHLADMEIAWAWRMRLISGEDHPILQPFEQDPWAKAYHGSGYTASAARTTWSSLRQWNLAFLDSLSEDDRHRPATHPEIGEIRLWSIVEIAAGHDLHHLHGLQRMAGLSLRS